jgi:hypothetical protein
LKLIFPNGIIDIIKTYDNGLTSLYNDINMLARSLFGHEPIIGAPPRARPAKDEDVDGGYESPSCFSSEYKEERPRPTLKKAVDQEEEDEEPPYEDGVPSWPRLPTRFLDKEPPCPNESPRANGRGYMPLVIGGPAPVKEITIEIVESEEEEEAVMHLASDEVDEAEEDVANTTIDEVD